MSSEKYATLASLGFLIIVYVVNVACMRNVQIELAFSRLMQYFERSPATKHDVHIFLRTWASKCLKLMTNNLCSLNMPKLVTEVD